MAAILGTPREEFLQSVRLALGREAGPPKPLYDHLEQTLPELEAQAEEIHRRVAENRVVLLDRLAEVAQRNGWQICRSSNPEEAVAYIGAVAQGLADARVVRLRPRGVSPGAGGRSPDRPGLVRHRHGPFGRAPTR